MMIMFIKISQLIAIGLLLLVGCSAEPSNKVTLKVISKYELIQVGDSIAFRRC
jgi:uncharacterized protein YcfL